MLETDDCGRAADQLVDAFCLSCSFFAFFRFIALAALLARENENDVRYPTLLYSVTEDSPSWRVFVSWPRDLRACYPQRPSAADVCSSQGGRVTPDARETPTKKDGAVLWPSPPPPLAPSAPSLIEPAPLSRTVDTLVTVFGGGAVGVGRHVKGLRFGSPLLFTLWWFRSSREGLLVSA